MLRRKTAYTIQVEGVNDQHHDGQVEKAIRGAGEGGGERLHAILQRRSSLCVMVRMTSTITRMSTATAAPSGQL